MIVKEIMEALSQRCFLAISFRTPRQQTASQKWKTTIQNPKNANVTISSRDSTQWRQSRSATQTDRQRQIAYGRKALLNWSPHRSQNAALKIDPNEMEHYPPDNRESANRGRSNWPRTRTAETEWEIVEYHRCTKTFFLLIRSISFHRVTDNAVWTSIRGTTCSILGLSLYILAGSSGWFQSYPIWSLLWHSIMSCTP